MGKFDRRASQKMKRRKAQVKKKERVARKRAPAKKAPAPAILTNAACRQRMDCACSERCSTPNRACKYLLGLRYNRTLEPRIMLISVPEQESFFTRCPRDAKAS